MHELCRFKEYRDDPGRIQIASNFTTGAFEIASKFCFISILLRITTQLLYSYNNNISDHILRLVWFAFFSKVGTHFCRLTFFRPTCRPWMTSKRSPQLRILAALLREPRSISSASAETRTGIVALWRQAGREPRNASKIPCGTDDIPSVHR